MADKPVTREELPPPVTIEQNGGVYSIMDGLNPVPYCSFLDKGQADRALETFNARRAAMRARAKTGRE